MKTKIILIVLALLASYGFGRWSAPEKIKTTDTTKTDVNRDKHKKTTITETEKPDGTKEKKTTITEDTETTKKVDNEKTSEITRASAKVTISALAGTGINLQPGGPTLTPVFGLSMSKPILGPITVGVWGIGVYGFGGGAAGASVGLTF